MSREYSPLQWSGRVIVVQDDGAQSNVTIRNAAFLNITKTPISLGPEIRKNVNDWYIGYDCMLSHKGDLMTTFNQFNFIQ